MWFSFTGVDSITWLLEKSVPHGFRKEKLFEVTRYFAQLCLKFKFGTEV